MMPTWQSGDMPQMPRVTVAGWCLVLLRMVVIVILILVGMAILLAARVAERLFLGARRPVSGLVTQVFARLCLPVMGLHWCAVGRPLAGAGAMTANHSSWIDILALMAGQRVVFVSKAEVAGWPGIGFLARAAGTLFIRRERREAREHVAQFRERLAAGQRLVFFPEGTSTDSTLVLPFKPTLFAAFLDDALREGLQVQPVTVSYQPPAGEDARFYGWWGDMDLGPHLIAVLSRWRRGRVRVNYHPALRVADFTDRKLLAKAAETAVRAGFSPPSRDKAH